MARSQWQIFQRKKHEVRAIVQKQQALLTSSMKNGDLVF